MGMVGSSDLSELYKLAGKENKALQAFIEEMNIKQGLVLYKGEWVTKEHIWYDQILEIEDE